MLVSPTVRDNGGIQPTRPRSAMESRAALAGKRAVIVEDEGITQMQLRRILTNIGMTVVGSAMTGENGIEVVLRERPDIVLMDIKMPGAIDGLEATRRILAQFRTCVMMLTAYSDYQEEAEKLGASGYIIKPVDSATLVPSIWDAYVRFRSG